MGINADTRYSRKCNKYCLVNQHTSAKLNHVIKEL